MAKLLVVDDEPDVAAIINMAFQYHRPEHDISEAYSGREALECLRARRYDLVILDVSMPEMDGLEVLRRIRESSDLPVILLTAKGMEQDKVRGLELGADDYVVKPFGHKELIARVEAVLRRVGTAVPSANSQELVQHQNLTIDLSQHRVLIDGQPVELTPTEYRLLYHLAANRGRVMPQNTLLAKVWGASYRDELHYLKVYVRRLREKLEADPAHPSHILTVRGVGYTFPPEDH